MPHSHVQAASRFGKRAPRLSVARVPRLSGELGCRVKFQHAKYLKKISKKKKKNLNTYRRPSPVSCSAPSSETRRSPRGTFRTSPSDWLVHFTHQQRSSTIISTTNHRSSAESRSISPVNNDHHQHRLVRFCGMCSSIIISTTNHRSAAASWPISRINTDHRPSVSSFGTMATCAHRSSAAPPIIASSASPSSVTSSLERLGDVFDHQSSLRSIIIITTTIEKDETDIIL